MTRHDLVFSDAHSGDDGTCVPVDALIRPGLLRAFPLPSKDHSDNERFRMLLQALAQGSQGQGDAGRQRSPSAS